MLLPYGNALFSGYAQTVNNFVFPRYPGQAGLCSEGGKTKSKTQASKSEKKGILSTRIFRHNHLLMSFRVYRGTGQYAVWEGRPQQNYRRQ